MGGLWHRFSGATRAGCLFCGAEWAELRSSQIIPALGGSCQSGAERARNGKPVLPVDSELEGDVRRIANIDAIEVGAVGDVLSFEEVVIENVAAGQVERSSWAEGILYASGHALIDVEKAVVAANPLRQQI